MKKHIPIIGLLAISLLVHFVWFGHPNTTVFDEVHFGKFISAYFTHQYYFDIHPPLGKLILAGWGWLWGFRPGFSFATIGEVYPDHLYLALRFLPTLAGALLPLVLYGIARQLRMSRTAALTAGMLVALDNALLVQSRFILLDAFLLLFGFSAIWCYLKYYEVGPRKNGGPTSIWWLAGAGLLGGMAMSIKWTGATFLALIVILEIIRLRRFTVKSFVALIVLPLLLYGAVFATHFALLSRPGPGDAFMSQAFQHNQENFGQKFIELNEQMYLSNQHLTASHPYSSRWYTWPFMQRSIFYWVAGSSRIYLLGNPIVWWGSTIALIIFLMEFALSGLRGIKPVPAILVGAWLMNMLPFLGISRVMFLYHYFTALIWAILMLAYLIDQSPYRRRIAIALVICASVAFVFFAPLSYGLPLSDAAYHLRLWLPTWQ